MNREQNEYPLTVQPTGILSSIQFETVNEIKDEYEINNEIQNPIDNELKEITYNENNNEIELQEIHE